jgi:hypothetical protein
MYSKACKGHQRELAQPRQHRGNPGRAPAPQGVRRSETSWNECAVWPDDFDDSGFQTFVEGTGI